ncbi:hypothetical protein AB0O76_32015 [Streptomyces sp. NPDC086554]|uniref:hypothetical protein n=1 Tax=Streptomyces sp. NPDC086554 TaxID=3154864 RepID=UPI00343546EB
MSMPLQSLTSSARCSLMPRTTTFRPPDGVWRSLDWYVQETMGARSCREAQSIVKERWNRPEVACLRKRAYRLGNGQVEPVALRLAAISVNCGWLGVISEAGAVATGIPGHFADVWAVVAQRLGTVQLGAAPLLAVVNHASSVSPGDGLHPVLKWTGTEWFSRIDLLLATAARIDAINASVLLKSHLLEHGAARPLTVVRALDRVTRVQSIVHDVLARRHEAVANAPCPAAGLTAARTLAAEAPDVPDGVPPRLLTPVQQAVEALLGLHTPAGGPAGIPRARRCLGREQLQALLDLDRVGHEVRVLAENDRQVAAAYGPAVMALRESNTLYRRLIDAAVEPLAERGRVTALAQWK